MVLGLTRDTNDLWRYFLNAQAQGQSFDIESLPPELKKIVESKRAEFKEGDPDKIDTENETRKLLEQAMGLDPKALPNAPGMDALKNLSQQELMALLVDWILNKQGGDQNRPSGGGQHRGTMQPQSFSNVQPASFNGGGGGSYGGGGGGGTSATSGGGGVAPTGRPTDTASIKGNTNAEKAFNYFIQKGLTPEQAAGIVANLQAESGVKPGQHQIGGPAFGIAQWEGGRQDNLRAFAAQQGKPVDDLGVQLDFLWQELQGPENAAFQALKGARTAYEAAAIFENKFERPAANHNAERGAIANQVLAEFGRGDGSMNA